MDPPNSIGGTGQPNTLLNLFGPLNPNPTASQHSVATQPSTLGPIDLFSLPQSNASTNTTGVWPGNANSGLDGMKPAPAATSPFSLGGIYDNAYGSGTATGLSGTGAQKASIDLFNTSTLPNPSNVAQSHMNSVPVFGPTSHGDIAAAAERKAAMPSLPPAASNAPSDEPATAAHNNIHHPSADPAELRTSLLALSPSSPSTEASMVRAVRPVELPPSDYRRDIMSGDRHTFAYITNLRNVGPAIRVWRRPENVAVTLNPFLNPANLSLKDYIGTCTDMHMTTYHDNTVIATGDAQGNVSIHLFPSTPKASPTATTTAEKHCLLRILDPQGSQSTTRVLRVFWHPMLPLVLAIAYSDGIVSVWNLAEIIPRVMQRDLATLPAPELIMASEGDDGSPICYSRPTSRHAVVVSMPHGEEVLTDVVMWGNEVFTATANGMVFWHDLATGAVQRFMHIHKYGVGALVLATCPAIDSGYMPLFATTSGDGSEIKLWRHASRRADWTCLQCLSLPRQQTPYTLSRYSMDDTFFLYNGGAGTAWELKLFKDEMALLPGNYYADLACNSLLMIPAYKIIMRYTKDALTVNSYPDPTFPPSSTLAMQSVPSSTMIHSNSDSAAPTSSASSAIPAHAHTVPLPQPSTPSYEVQKRESSFSSNPLASLMQTQVPPQHPNNLPELPPRPATTSSAQKATIAHPIAIPSSPAAPAPPTVPSHNTTHFTIADPTMSNPSGNKNMNAAIQALLEESRLSLAERVRQQREIWTQEDKQFLRKFNEGMRSTTTVVAERIQQRLAQIPAASVDVPELTRALASALGQPIGLAFKDQFTDVLVPAMEDATAKMLRRVDGKLKAAATNHAQTVAVNDVARSVEPLVASLMHATTEMTRSISEMKVPTPVTHAPKTKQTSTPVGTPKTPAKALQTTPPQAAAASPAKPKKDTKATEKTPAKAPAAAAPTPTTAAPTTTATTTTTAAPTPPAPKKEKAKKDKPAPAPPARSPPSTASYPSEYWLFALRHGVHLD